MTRKFADYMVERQSRRGFLAWCGKVALALGAAMTGVSLTGLTARAACCGTQCTGCPDPPAICPPGYAGSGPPTMCCNTGTSTCHTCQLCHSDMLNPPDCYCEQDTGKACLGLC